MNYNGPTPSNITKFGKVLSVEFSLIEKDVLFGLQQGNKVLKEVHKEMNLDSVEKLMSDTNEAIAYQREIDEMTMSKMNVEEEEEVEQELESLQAQENSQLKVQLSIPIDLPDAAKTCLPELPNPVLEQVESQEPGKQLKAIPA
ncbi:uncharacterized protein MELLADRAFT_84245 [Melampsora larici-populina 98AG31]|uniref:Uncharacterized protein n=1 Tax=Melampsora larici-populina (strain 98AG31 / pathotype 3-4-7) TaxID=747676 RepID=F4RF11_MELLP|nr:uncharacterized protein MELLADRAFT_84245 [Melampsora larici-populina 98AG31]EGG09021.1 hypothetical protein MELLADRAFT_84245 [Melampsora larici-populina 98AG31]